MSNHIGGAMLNQMLHGLVDSGLLQKITPPQKKSLFKLLSRMEFDYDCNWSEIIDSDLAVLLSACMNCRRDSTEICADDGYCLECSQKARQEAFLWGEELLLCWLLDHRFGRLPSWVEETLRKPTLSEENIFRWSERLLHGASSLEEVFDTRGHA
jgi:hypothetical protein